MNIQFFGEKKKDNIKALNETRAEKVHELELLYAKLEAEKRAVTEEEENQIGAIQNEIDQIDKTVEILNNIKTRLVKTNEGKKDVIEDVREGERAGEQRAQDEEKEFASFLRGAAIGEVRADTNMTLTDNGAVIPTTIANRIIKKIYDISPVLEKSTKFQRCRDGLCN